MLLSTLYRENHYHPLYALRSSLSILLEIPFFIAAYHYLSHCPILNNASFAFLHNLGAPDNLIALGTFHINILPVIMTLINIASAAVYLKGFPLRDKIQTYALAAIFLVLLYNSPSGLVFYWILNNLFSLLKNVVTKYAKHPVRVVHVVITLTLIFAAVYILTRGDIHNKLYRALAVITPIFIALAPFIKNALKKFFTTISTIMSHNGKNISKVNSNTNTADSIISKSPSSALLKTTYRAPFFLLLSSTLSLCLLCGVLLTSNAIATSPIEFSFIGTTNSPLTYIWKNLAIFLGAFAFWPLVIYKMFGDKTKRVMPYLFCFLCIMAVLDVVVFGYNYGMMDIYFKLDEPKVLKNYSAFYTLGFFLVAIVVVALLYLIKKVRFEKHLTLIIFACCLAQIVYLSINISKISTKYSAYVASNGGVSKLGQASKITPVYHLSKTAQNVVVFYLDSAVSTVFPLILQQFPELTKSFDGFIYYPNTVSFGTFTLMGSPAMCGGYEYTIDAMNARSNELLRDKHNEAITLMPRLFSDAGWGAIVTDPPFSNYAWSGDKTPFIPYPNIDVKFIYKNYYNQYIKRMKGAGGAQLSVPDLITQKHSMAFVLMEALPPIFRSAIYDSARYLQAESQNRCVAQYSHFYFLGDLTDTTSDKNSFVFFCNDLPHEPALLQEPQYCPAVEVNEKKAGSGFYKAKSTLDKEIYHVNAAAIKQFAKYLDRLRTLGVYDNTRIILVGDHGKGASSPDENKLASKYMPFNPLLLYKDFNNNEPLATDDTFMTNGDTLFLAKDGLGLSDTNPATGKVLTQDKDLVTLYKIAVTAKLKNADMKGEYTWRLQGGKAFTVHDDIFNPSNWNEKDCN